MLYVTTRSDPDAFTAQRVLRDRRGPDGGLFVPFRLPRLSDEAVAALGEKSFNAAAAEGLNLLLNTHLTGYDLDFTTGRRCVRLKGINDRLFVAECWHNPDWNISRMVHDVTDLASIAPLGDKIGDWPEVAVRIGIFFGVFSDLIRIGVADTHKKVDISIVAGDFSGPMSAWYARAMGLPIGNILCCCNDNGNLWDFICHGVLRTDGVAKTTPVPEGDLTVPPGLERLIYAFGGELEVEHYLQKLRLGETYYMDDRLLHNLRHGMYATVSSSRRVISTIPAMYTTHGYLAGPGTALTYAGLQDYRARTGENRPALIISEKSPRLSLDLVADALGTTEETIAGII